MWRWWRRPEVVLAADDGDDAVAALTTIVRFHGRSASYAEVSQAIYEDGDAEVNALKIARAAERFGLQTRGLLLEHPRQLTKIPTPSIAQMSRTSAAFPRRLGEVDDGYFAVVTAISVARVRWIHPYEGPLDAARAEFLAVASGVFLLFTAATSLPRASLIRS